MTSRSLFFKLQREDLKRRVWAIALSILGFFFALPINLALSMENAINTDFFLYNNYSALAFLPGTTEAERVVKILEMKTKVVMAAVEFGNGLTAFLLMAAAVIVGVSSFSYLHNRKKVDFYHSIPVRREMLFSVQFIGGLLIVAVTYLLNLLFLLGVSSAYGVKLTSVLGPAMAGWLLNMLYFLLMYAVAAVAMMMTGNILIGILANGVFNFFAPGMAALITSYCDIFFKTMSSHFWEEGGRFVSGFMKWGSPFSAYMMALSWGGRYNDGRSEVYQHIPALVITFFVAVGLALLAMELYRRRPSEAAGKAMAFRWSMAPIRILMAVGFGLSGGLFFWAMQSTLFWALFGAVIGCVISHCVIEIIYHFDFKKLFSHKLQLALCLCASILIILAFRFDWFGYDSYLPDQSRVANVSLDIDLDDQWVSRMRLKAGRDGLPEVEYQDSYDVIPDTMHLSDAGPAFDIARLGRDEALKARDRSFIQQTALVERTGSTACWIASSDETDDGADGQDYFTNFTVIYTLNSGRKVSRQYYAPLSEAMDSYNRLYGQKEYKEGLYSILSVQPGNVAEVRYLSQGVMEEVRDMRPDGYAGLLAAYQADLRDLTLKTRTEENVIGQLQFYAPEELQLLEQYLEKIKRNDPYNYRYVRQDISQSWPVYPSFKRTIELMTAAGTDPRELRTGIQNMRIHLSPKIMWTEEEQKSGEADLERLLALNPRFIEDGSLMFEDPEEIRLLMSALVLDEDMAYNGMCPTVSSAPVTAVTKGNLSLYGNLQVNRMTPELLKLFTGTPMKELMSETRGADVEYVQQAGTYSFSD